MARQQFFLKDGKCEILGTPEMTCYKGGVWILIAKGTSIAFLGIEFHGTDILDGNLSALFFSQKSALIHLHFYLRKCCHSIPTLETDIFFLLQRSYLYLFTLKQNVICKAMLELTLQTISEAWSETSYKGRSDSSFSSYEFQQNGKCAVITDTVAVACF